MFCMNCGQRLDDGAKFCSACGASIDANGNATPRGETPPVAGATPAAASPQPGAGAPYAQQPPVQNACAQQPRPVSATAYLVWAIIVTLLCFLPTGIPGIVYASNISRYNETGQFDLARDAANKSRIWTIVSAAVGVLLNIIVFFLIFSMTALHAL